MYSFRMHMYRLSTIPKSHDVPYNCSLGREIDVFPVGSGAKLIAAWDMSRTKLDNWHTLAVWV